MSVLRNILLVLCCSVAAPVSDNIPPAIHIQILDFGMVNVSWGHGGVRLGNSYLVKVKTPDMEKEHEVSASENFYTFDLLAVHRGLSVRVVETEDLGEYYRVKPGSMQWTSTLPPFTGDEGTEPSRLTCDIHFNASDVRWLSCDWLPGENAPLDTIYYFYFRYLDSAQECPYYVTEPGGGRRIGCRTAFSNVPIYEPEFLVHINGSSHSRHIRAMEHVFTVDNIEVIPPVRNLTLNAEGRRLSWSKPIDNYADICFNYQINIWSKGKNETITVSKVQHFWNEDLEAPTNRRHVRVRAVGKPTCWPKLEKYSAWTEVICIGDADDDMLWVTITVCLLIACLAVFLLCIRFWRSLFPRIPKPKDDLKDAFNNTQHQVLMRCNSWDTEEVVSYIETMGSLDKQYKMSLDYGYVAD